MKENIPGSLNRSLRRVDGSGAGTSLLIVVLLLFGAIVAVGTAGADIPTLNIVRTDSPIVIDGTLSESAWEKAATIDQFVSPSTGEPVSEQTKARLLYDDDAIYIAFECQESRMDILSATVEEQGGPVYLDDSIEIFLAPYPVATRDNYYHFCANVNGVQYSEHKEVYDWDKFGWDVATSKGEKAWTAEVRIPFELLSARGVGGSLWRLNLCRNEIPHGQASCWSATGPRFHNPPKFGKLVGIDVPSLNIGLTGPPEPLESTGGKSAPEPLEQVFDYDAAQPKEIIPKPVQCEFTSENFRIQEDTKIYLPHEPTDEDRWTAETLNYEIELRGGKPLEIAAAPNGVTPGNGIFIGEPWRNRQTNIVVKLNGFAVTESSPGPEGYALVVNDKAVGACGSDSAGSFYAVQSLRQLLRRDEKGLYFTGCRVFDWPRFAFRGVHLLLDKNSPEIHGKMIERLFSKYKINTIVYEIEQGYQWESHPEIANKGGCSRAGLEQLLETGKRHFITSYPLVQTLGHLEFLFKAHPEIVEDPNEPYAYCPLNPKSYELMFDLFDEAIEVFGQPEYLHIGHDEFDMRGGFPTHEKCREIGKEALYEMDTMKLYEYLREKNVKTMMWGDVLLKKGYEKMVDRLPKDMLITDWHYSASKDFPSVPFFTSRRLPVVCCPWYVIPNIVGFSRFASEHNTDGMLQTTWTGYFGNRTALENLTADLYCYILAAEYAWSPEAPEIDENYNAANLFTHIWSDEERAHRKGIALDLGPWMNVSLATDEQREGWLSVSTGHDLRDLPEGQTWLQDGIQYSLSKGRDSKAPAAVMLQGSNWAENFPLEARTIPVGEPVEYLNFLHATAWMNEENARVGKCIVHYADGSTVEIPITQNKEIYGWLQNKQSKQTRVAWSGQTQDGLKTYLNSYRWKNPKPGVAISSIDIVSETPDGPMVVFAITAEST